MKRKTGYRIITLLIPVLCLIIFLEKDVFLSLASNFPPCILLSTIHLYCPACGNTRSVMALLNLDLVSALHYNIVPPILLLLSLAAYFELATYSFGHHIKVLPRKLKVYLIGIGLIYLYLLIRNFIPQLTPQ
jgi:hypothetical protein